MPPQKPTRPVPRGGGAPLVAGRYKVEPEDFVVDEIPAYEPCGTGDHVFLFVEKRGLSTMDLLHALAVALDRNERSFGIAGLKDARAVSRQWISLEHADEARCRDLAGDGFRVLRTSRHGNKLRLGHLRGNRFRITLRGAGADELPAVQENLARLSQFGVPNYFGEQRFGKRGANLQKGIDILLGNPHHYARTMPRRVFGLVLSAVQSEVFNRVVMARLGTLDRLLVGDLAFLHQKGAVFPVKDPDAEQERVARLDLSPSGPMPGPQMPWPEGEPLEHERRAIADLGLPVEAFGELPFGVARGERRPLRVPVGDPIADLVDGGLQLAFDLPRGAYATSVLRELLVDTIWFAE